MSEVMRTIRTLLDLLKIGLDIKEHYPNIPFGLRFIVDGRSSQLGIAKRADCFMRTHSRTYSAEQSILVVLTPVGPVPSATSKPGVGLPDWML